MPRNSDALRIKEPRIEHHTVLALQHLIDGRRSEAILPPKLTRRP
jgi:hypothetical protein